MKLHYYARLIGIIIVLTACGGDRISENSAVKPVPPDTSAKAYEQAIGVYDATFLADFRKNSKTYTSLFISAEGVESLEILYRKGSTEPAVDLKDDGFATSFDELILATKSTEHPSDTLVHLHISKTGIHDSNGIILIDQIEARYGYGWRLGHAMGSETTPTRSYLVIIMLDENGAANSDELFIYRSFDSGKLGDFIVTNLPNELL